MSAATDKAMLEAIESLKAEIADLKAERDTARESVAPFPYAEIWKCTAETPCGRTLKTEERAKTHGKAGHYAVGKPSA